MTDFYRALHKSSAIVSHNTMFDCNVLSNHLWRYQMGDILDLFIKMPTYCTSVNSTNILKIPLYGNPDTYKYPSLKELYFHFFK